MRDLKRRQRIWASEEEAQKQIAALRELTSDQNHCRLLNIASETYTEARSWLGNLQDQPDSSEEEELNLFTNVLVFVALASIIIAHYHLRLTIDFGSAMLSMTMGAALGLGIGAMNSVLFLASPTYQSIWNIATRPQMLVSGVFFLINGLPEYIFKYLKWNPLAQVIAEMRHAFYPNYDSSFVNPAYVFLIAGITFTLGMVGLHRYVFDALEK